MIRRPPRSTQSRSSAASDVYKRQLYSFEPILDGCPGGQHYHRNITGLGVLAHCSTDFRAVDARHHHIKDDYVRSEILYRIPVSYTHLRAHETRHDLVCRLLLEKKKKNQLKSI